MTRKAGDDDSWYVADPEAIQGYGTITQLTDHASRRVDKKEPIGFKVTKKRDENMAGFFDDALSAGEIGGPKPQGEGRGMPSGVHLAINAELANARKWPGFNSAHEGYAILREEVDELWDHVKVNQVKRDLVAMRAEAIQVAAMAIKFVEMIDAGRGRV